MTGHCLLGLSKAVECLTSLLAPFDWQHLLVPVLPESLLELVEAPTPYLIGILNPGQPFRDLIDNIGEVNFVLSIYDSKMQSLVSFPTVFFVIIIVKYPIPFLKQHLQETTWNNLVRDKNDVTFLRTQITFRYCSAKIQIQI